MIRPDVAAVAALWAGAVLAVPAGGKPWIRGAVAGLVQVLAPTLVFGHMVPDAWEDGGPLTLLAAGVGILLPALYHRHARGCATNVAVRHGHHKEADGHPEIHESRAAVLVALEGLLVHMTAESAGMAAWPPGNAGVAAMTTAVVIHRLPIGMALWWVVRAQAGATAATAVLFLCSALTFLGYLAGGVLAGPMTTAALSWVQALLAGSLLHAAHAHVSPGAGEPRRAVAVGAGAGAILLSAAAVLRAHGLTGRVLLQVTVTWVACAAVVLRRPAGHTRHGTVAR